MTVPVLSNFDINDDRKEVSALCNYFEREDTNMQ